VSVWSAAPWPVAVGGVVSAAGVVSVVAVPAAARGTVVGVWMGVGFGGERVHAWGERERGAGEQVGERVGA
jgi:hypothetical protein